MQLNDVYSPHEYQINVAILYGLLKNRLNYPNINISHKEMPTPAQHYDFVRNKPYLGWYLISDKDKFIGSIYVGKENNIGIHILEEHQHKGCGRKTLQEIMKLYPLPYYLANINPNNSASIAFFSNFGFKYHSTLMEADDQNYEPEVVPMKIIQYTYKFTPSDVKL